MRLVANLPFHCEQLGDDLIHVMITIELLDQPRRKRATSDLRAAGIASYLSPLTTSSRVWAVTVDVRLAARRQQISVLMK
ncbi:MAG: hypothetical protein O3C17_27000 [Planctomycetota bacterium]|nr:hypothetical protein [Planctomycetota bacterium]